MAEPLEAIQAYFAGARDFKAAQELAQRAVNRGVIKKCDFDTTGNAIFQNLYADRCMSGELGAVIPGANEVEHAQ